MPIDTAKESIIKETEDSAFIGAQYRVKIVVRTTLEIRKHLKISKEVGD